MASSDADKKKLILAVVLLAAAGAVIAWNLGLFSGGSTPAPTTPVTVDPNAPKGGGAREIK